MMSRKPFPDNHEARRVIWAAISKLRRFCVPDIRGETGFTSHVIHYYLRALDAAKYVQRVGREMRKNRDGRSREVMTYELIRHIDVPHVWDEGQPVYRGLGQQQMWQAMRTLPEFNVRDLAIHASTENHKVGFNHAKRYIQFLHKAGYLVVLSPHAAGAGGRPARYRLYASKYSGPLPPMLQNAVKVWDPNLRRIVWSQDIDE